MSNIKRMTKRQNKNARQRTYAPRQLRNPSFRASRPIRGGPAHVYRVRIVLYRMLVDMGKNREFRSKPVPGACDWCPLLRGWLILSIDELLRKWCGRFNLWTGYWSRNILYDIRCLDNAQHPWPHEARDILLQSFFYCFEARGWSVHRTHGSESLYRQGVWNGLGSRKTMLPVSIPLILWIRQVGTWEMKLVS